MSEGMSPERLTFLRYIATTPWERELVDEVDRLLGEHKMLRDQIDAT